ncbi:hypothetical protein QE152_g24651 [Popillia japonica]|uniref:Uncharacterized protein n=1 Tax=Popillia japonica TaxID=7064 RepID=A0AAW1K4M7_POPJA
MMWATVFSETARQPSVAVAVDGSSTVILSHGDSSVSCERYNANAYAKDTMQMLTPLMECLRTANPPCKKLQSESLVREEQAKELIEKLEKTEANLNKKIEHIEEKTKHDEKVLRSQLTEAKLFVKKSQDTFILLTEEVQAKQEVVSHLQEELQCLKEKYHETKQENNRLYKKVQEIESKPYRRKRLDSLTELIDINQDINFESLGHTELIEQCLDLRNRLETAVMEIKVMKKELRESHIKYDQLELETVGLRKNLHIIEQESLAQSTLMADRVQDLTVKLATAEKQARNLKSKLQDSREKRRSLSLKGRENFSINKEIEDKITELEAKIITLEKNKSRRKQRRDRSGDRISPIDDKSQRRLRRKSLDSATSSEPMKLFMRLNNLEGKIMNSANSNESLNTSSASYSDTKTDEIGNTNLYAECVILAAIEKLNNCKYACNLLRTNTSNIYVDELNILENNLSELSCILKSNVRENEINTIYSSVDRIVRQLETILKEKLHNLYDKKKALMKSCRLNDEAKLEILAEKIAYENVIINRIDQALSVSAFNNNWTRHFLKESLETMNLLCNLNEKLCDKRKKEIPLFKTSVDYLTKILTKRLLTAAHSYNANMPLTNKFAPALSYLEEKQLEISNLMRTYKLHKLPQLADALALEAITTATDSNCNVHSLGDDMLDEIKTVARNVVNCELIESEINHIMMRTAQLYEQKASLDQSYCFTFFAYERATLELWSDSVETQLQIEMDKNIEELTKIFNYSLTKLRKQDWRTQLESQWPSINVKALLLEFADIISHKSLIDARIKVLKSEYKVVDKDMDNYNDDSLLVYLKNEKYLSCIDDTDLLRISNTLEAEFKCMFNKYKRECENTLMKADLLEVKNTLSDLSMQILDIVNCCTGKAIKDLMPISSLQDICNQCEHLKKLLIDIKDAVIYMKTSSRTEVGEEKLPLHLGTEYLSQVENLRSAYRRSLGDCDSRKQQTDIERLQVLCEQVLLAMEHWHRKTLQELREQHTRELQALHRDKEQALAEETQATLAALDAMRKAHEAEVQREVARFKRDFARQQQDELLDLTERLSVKCLEAAALEEQLGIRKKPLTLIAELTGFLHT